MTDSFGNEWPECLEKLSDRVFSIKINIYVKEVKFDLYEMLDRLTCGTPLFQNRKSLGGLI